MLKLTNMFFLFYIFIFIFGLIIGSFLNSVIYRLSLPNFSFWKNSVKEKRSYCPNCKHKLATQDLIPVVSFLFLKGKCRHCHKKISFLYPIVEILTGLVFLLIFCSIAGDNISSVGPSYQVINILFLFYIVSSLIVIFFYDLKHYIIPDKILFPAIIIAVLYQLFFNFEFFIFNALISGIGAFLFFGLIFFISRGEWMGFGDCKLVVLLGLILGFPNILLGLFLSFFLGAIIGLGLMIGNKKGLKSQIPFAPFLITGSFVALLSGREIINWYMGLLF